MKEYKGDQKVKVEFFDELGNAKDPPNESVPIPFDGQEGWNKYLSMNMKFPQDARRNRKNATVQVYFMVDKQGDILNPEIMNPEEVLPSMAKGILRVVKAYPHKWTPHPVTCALRLPISFSVP